MKRFLLLFVLAAAYAISPAGAQVRVTKGAGQKYSIDWSTFSVQPTAAGALFKKTLQDDLTKSGWFIPASAGRAAVILQGTGEDSGSSLEAKCYVYEASSRRNLLSKRYNAKENDARQLAHQIANDIIEAVTGQKGLFAGRLVLVGRRTGRKELYLCDPDGQNLIQLTKDNSISLAPKWSPDGQTIVYTAYLKGYPDLYTIDVASGNRTKLAGFPGLNTSAAIAPNGREVAMVLSKDGNPDLYIKNLRGGEPTRVTSGRRTAAASPSWSPDGSRIVFVSDQSGTPQLYIVSRDGGAPKRITSRGAQNVAPNWGSNELIVYSSLVGGRFQVCVMDPNTMENKQITADDSNYEDPCWAPDGRHIVCCRTHQYHSAIYLLDTLGDPPIAFIEIPGDWFSPAWSAK